MNVLLKRTITIYTYDKTTLILRAGTLITIDPKNHIASAQGYCFDIDPAEYAIIN